MEKVSDAACVSADGSTYTNPKYMVSIVTGAAGKTILPFMSTAERTSFSPFSFSLSLFFLFPLSGNREDEKGYVKGDPSYTGGKGNFGTHFPQLVTASLTLPSLPPISHIFCSGELWLRDFPGTQRYCGHVGLQDHRRKQGPEGLRRSPHDCADWPRALERAHNVITGY